MVTPIQVSIEDMGLIGTGECKNNHQKKVDFYRLILPYQRLFAILSLRYFCNWILTHSIIEAMLQKHLTRCFIQDQVQVASSFRLEIMKKSKGRNLLEVIMKRLAPKRFVLNCISDIPYTFSSIFHERIELETSAWSQKNQCLQMNTLQLCVIIRDQQRSH